MSGFLRLNTAPGNLVTVDEVKAQTRIDVTAEDGLLGDYIAAASGAIDGPLGMTGRAFGSQSWDYVMERFCTKFTIPVPGATSVTGLTYYDADDAEQTLTAGDYFYVIPKDDGLLLQLKDGVALPTTKRRDDAVTITVAAGGTVPEHIKHAALLTVASWYENREAGDVPVAAHNLIGLDRVGWAKS